MHFFLRIRSILTPVIWALAKSCPSPVSPSWKKIQTRIDFHITDSKRNVHYASFKIYSYRCYVSTLAANLPHWTLCFSFSRWNICALEAKLAENLCNNSALRNKLSNWKADKSNDSSSVTDDWHRLPGSLASQTFFWSRSLLGMRPELIELT